VVWSQLVDALLLLTGGLVLFGVWYSARLRDQRATQALRVSEERFRHLTSLSADWFWETDTQHRVSWLSGGPAVAALFGAEMAHGRRLWDVPGVLVEPRELVEHFERLEELDAQLPFFDFVISRSDAGERRVHRITGKPRYDAGGKFLGYRGVGQDITDKRRAERSLAEAKERLELATEGGNLAVWDCDVGIDTVFLSDGWARLLGEEPVARIARSSEVMARIHELDRDAVRDVFVRTLKGRAADIATNVEFRVRTAGNDWRWLLATGRVSERDEYGRALRMSGTVTDVDARKRAEQSSRDAEERYRTLIALAPIGVVVQSEGVIEYANPAAAAMLGAASPKHLMGLRAETFIHEEHREQHQRRVAYLQAGPGKTAFEDRRLRRLDGTETVIETAAVSYLERGRLVMQTILRDVTEQRKGREVLAESEQRFRDVLEASGEYVWETDAGWRYTFLSERVEAVLGYRRHELIGRTPREFMPLGELHGVEDWFERFAAGAKAFRNMEHRSISKSGRVVWQQVSGVPVLDAGGKLAGFRGTGTDITARKQAEDRIEYLATRDALTGLPNRALLADRANQAILAAARTRSSLALLYLDLDRFTLVNDSLGHAAGDKLLQSVASRLKACVRGSDAVARRGGDEFVVLLSEIALAEHAAGTAEKIIAAVLRRPVP